MMIIISLPFNGIGFPLSLIFSCADHNIMPPYLSTKVSVQTNQQILYGELSEKAELLARHLLLLGCRTGDVVAIFSPNSIEWCIVLVATFRIGAIPAAMDPFLSQGA